MNGNNYGPLEKWEVAPECYKKLNLKEKEYAIIVNPATGRGMYIVVKINGVMRYHIYIDSVQLPGFRQVPATFKWFNNLNPVVVSIAGFYW